MKNLFILPLFILSLYAENNSSHENNISSESNLTIVSDKNITSELNSSKVNKIEEQLKKQIEREKKFAKEQTFYQGDDYDLDYAKVNQETIDSVPLLEPDYDFNMDDVYD